MYLFAAREGGTGQRAAATKWDKSDEENCERGKDIEEKHQTNRKRERYRIFSLLVLSDNESLFLRIGNR